LPSARPSKEPNKRFTTLRSIAVVESVALLLLELCTHHGKPTEQGREGAKPRLQPKLKPHYQAIVDMMENASEKGLHR
jgi:hypothetical protein